jgi:hypothetical protein
LERDFNPPDEKAQTPLTQKRAGGRQVEKRGDDAFPKLHDSSGGEEEHEDIDEEVMEFPDPVPEDAVPVLQDPNNAPRKPRRLNSHSNPARRKGGSNSTGKSSRHLNSKSSSKRRGKRPTNPKGVPTVVPAPSPFELSPSIGRSPLSSSFNSTPTSMSMASSGRQSAALQALRQQLPPTGARKNKSLQMHVGRDSSPSNFQDDDYTLGASTITTNFSTTQRTFGDNTVSTRSLFQSERMRGSDLLRAPQRRGYDSGDDGGVGGDDDYDSYHEDEEEDEEDDTSNQGLMIETSLEGVNANFELLESEEKDNLLEDAENERAASTFKSPLRRPSGEGDDLFDAVDVLNNKHSHPSTDSDEEISRPVEPCFQLSPELRGALLGTRIVDGLVLKNTSIKANDGDDDCVEDDAPVPRKSSMKDLFRLGSSDHASRSPRNKLDSSKKKKSMRNLFRRVQSWKGVVALSDDDDENLID